MGENLADYIKYVFFYACRYREALYWAEISYISGLCILQQPYNNLLTKIGL